jgi:hypothetical protein
MRDELKWKEVDEQNAAIKWGLFETDTPSEEGWPDVLSSARWPDLEVGVEVSVEVRLDVGDLVQGNSTCRLLMLIGCLSTSDVLSLLCHCTVGTSFRSCSPAGHAY